MVSEKSNFQFSYVNNLGPRSRNDIDLEYSHIFVNSISCHFPLNFHFLVPKSLHEKFVKKAQWFFRKASFNFICK